MKYANANDVLPEELCAMIQEYYQGGYLYIPKDSGRREIRQTVYKTELEKRNRRIYVMHLEGRTNRQLGRIFHLSESSVRRIIAKEKTGYQKMKETIEQILPAWGIENRQIVQIYSSAWEINGFYVIKRYDDREQIERNSKIMTILSECGIPVADIVPAQSGENYAVHEDAYFLMSRKLQGSNISDRKDQATAYKMGCAIARLHRAFVKCEKEMEFWDNSLLKEMKGWVREVFCHNEWQIVGEEEYGKAVEALEAVYDELPRQLIHRDVHFGNFLFCGGELSGYIDFDLSQRNIRIFDICYFLTGLLSEETDDVFTKEEWLANVKAVIAGYGSICRLSAKEKMAIPCVMECIEMLCAAYFVRVKDTKRAGDACRIFRLIQNCESDIRAFAKDAGEAFLKVRYDSMYD
ncbi:MAG: phosphotransferase [Lachnospiraceae bacterium]|nr:phosphotransferase [Lachnospiraceae bacterium]